LKVGVACAYTSGLYGSFQAGEYLVTPSMDQIIEALHWVSRNGFKGFELEALSLEQLRELYKPRNISKLTEVYNSLGLEIPQFVAYCVQRDITDLDEAKRKEGLSNFEKVVEVSADLGIRLVTICTPPPRQIQVRKWTESYMGGPALEYMIPGNLSWETIWETLVESISRCCDIAEDSGLLFAIEPRVHEIVGNTDAALRMIDRVGSKNLGVDADVAHLFAQKEVLPISIEKLGKRMYAVHLSDNDGSAEYHYAPGRGKIEWQSLLEAVKKIGYEGFLTLEVAGVTNLEEQYIEGKRVVEEAAKELGIKIS